MDSQGRNRDQPSQLYNMKNFATKVNNVILF